MIYDCFSFYNELDILEIRLATLDEIVDKFVLVEADWTHTGKPKPLFFAENRTRFTPFLDKIIHIVVTDKDIPSFPATATDRQKAWIRENCQRNAIANGLTNAHPQDIILISDLDEIPNPNIVLQAVQRADGIANLNLKNYAFFLNNLNVSYPNWTGGPQLLTLQTFLDPRTYRGFQYSDYAPRCANPIPSATMVRFAPKRHTIRNAGWHLTSMGGLETLKAKIAAFAHTEFADKLPSDEELETRLRHGKGLFGFGDAFMPEPLSVSLPASIRENKQRYAPLLLSADDNTWRRTRFLRIGLRFRKVLHDRFIGIMLSIVPRALHPFFAKVRRQINLVRHG